MAKIVPGQEYADINVYDEFDDWKSTIEFIKGIDSTYQKNKVNYENSKLGQNVIELIASKVRYGTSGTIEMGYDGDKVKLYDSIDDYTRENPL